MQGHKTISSKKAREKIKPISASKNAKNSVVFGSLFLACFAFGEPLSNAQSNSQSSLQFSAQSNPQSSEANSYTGDNAESSLDSSKDFGTDSSLDLSSSDSSQKPSFSKDSSKDTDTKPVKKPTSIVEGEKFSLIYTGWVESFSKIGFNNQSIDANLGKYPTDSFSAMVGSFGLKSELKSQIQTLKAGLSVTAGALVYDSSSEPYPGGTGSVMNEYIGMWEGFDLQGKSSVKRHYYVVNNAYLDYELKLGAKSGFYLKGGRYESSAEYMSGYTQGFEVGLNLGNLKLWWFSSYGRAFAYGQWLVDFYAPRGYVDNSGKFIHNGIHAFKATYSFLGLDIIPAVYFSKGTYIAPIIEARYDSKRDFDGKGFRSQTTVHFMNPLHESRVVGNYRYGDLVGKEAQTLYIKQRFDINQYNFGLGLYKNFGNANAYIGTIGNPLSLDLWTTTAYDLGRNISDMIGKDAITPFVFVGGKHFDNRFSWNLISRYSDSRRSEEASIAGSFSYALGGGLSVGVKLEWLRDATKAGYRVGSNGSGSINGVAGASSEDTTKSTPKRTDDRSHSFIWVRYEF
ncbi:outer membrane family protein [Helicobacter macacae]|uniref:Outer membrane protein n=1 Tax=Helicobacter macacae MIT 99-5501 TaxID=1357400 RepID=V8C994_9HELI|nr:outer membrane family protein [Helicobacter macacae]ETD23326.1 hypothetical protein HMPREF2086_01125 [Helicobacter macacae MIT 99-5501]